MSTKTTINIKNKFDRVVVLVDMDCFYCQVEEKLNPAIRGKPIAVVQYNPWQGGGIIAVNYPARAEGVTRHMRGVEAKQHCPEIELPQVPQVRGKADLTRYREAGKEVADVLKSFTPLLERASIDEAYLDITERVLTRIHEMNEGKFQLRPEKLANTFAVGYENIGEFITKLSNTFDPAGGTAESNSQERLEYKKSDIKLLVGASIVNEIRAAVKERTGFECSAGIAHNKILAKLTAGFHKPNKQTILPINSIPKLYETLPLKKVKGLGGKLGDQVCEVLKIKFMSELVQFPESVLQQHFEQRMGSWMYLMARGIDLEAVTAKFHSKSIGCCKRFPGKNAITGLATLHHWLNELASEVTERLEKDLDENNRTAKQLTVSYSQQIDNVDVSSTRSIALVAYDAERIAADALDAIKRNTERFFASNSTTALHNPIKFLGISARKFEPNGAGKGGGIKQMFQSYTSKAANADEQPRETERRKSVSGETPDVVTEIPKGAGTSKEEQQQIEKGNDASNGEPSKPKGLIQHFLQRQSALAPVSASKSEETGSEVKTTNASSSSDASNEEPSKPKGLIQHFLQRQSALAPVSVSKSAETESEAKTTNASSSSEDVNQPESKSKKGIAQFLQPKSAINKESSLGSGDLSKSPSTVESIEPAAKPKKGIEQFLKSKSDVQKETATENEQEKEGNTNDEAEAVPYLDDTVELAVPEQEENQTPESGMERDVQISAPSTIHESEDPPEEKPSTSKASFVERSNAATKPDYKETYAEYSFQVPEPTLECPQCKKPIPEHEFQSHQDFHFALSLSQQQGDEFRNDLKTKLTSKSPLPAKRTSKAIVSAAPSSGSSGAPSANLSIARFLSKVSPESIRSSSAEVATGSNSKADEVPENHTKCSDCGKFIPLDSLDQHNDYHVAKRLQQELNRLEVVVPSQSTSKPALVVVASGASSSTKRKRPANSSDKVTSPVKQKLKPLSSYFTKL
ncbi:DNApol-eta [Anopheles merus]|uniref:DNA polymerase eta n=1 Tax=Anopheles merus TaxID=30066 RepID=A0A182UXK7_ANOME|nr:DNApol-eta [Anopheles merus]